MAQEPDNPGVVQAGLKLGNTVVSSLAPQFLALILINALFLGAMYWFIDARARHTVDLVNRLLATCLERVGQ